MLKWCLDEGLRQVQWLMLRKAHTIALSQDARNHRLLLRLTMSSENFERSSFVVGQLPCLGTNSHQVAETTNLLIQNFATPLANVPKYGILRLLPAADVSPCQSVLDILHSKTEALVTDAASDEMKSGRLLSGKEQSQFAASLFRNNIFIVLTLFVFDGRFGRRPVDHPGGPVSSCGRRARVKDLSWLSWCLLCFQKRFLNKSK